MRLLIPILYLLAFSKTLQAAPVPAGKNASKGIRSGFWDKISWQKYLPTIGAVGTLGVLASLVFLGTRAEQKFQETQVKAEEEEYARLAPPERIYLGPGTRPEIPKLDNMDENDRKKVEPVVKEFGKQFEGLAKIWDVKEKIRQEHEKSWQTAAMGMVRAKEAMWAAQAAMGQSNGSQRVE